MGLLQGANEQLGKLGIYFPRDNCLTTCIVKCSSNNQLEEEAQNTRTSATPLKEKKSRNFS
jgi:hypothetical protein